MDSPRMAVMPISNPATIIILAICWSPITLNGNETTRPAAPAREKQQQYRLRTRPQGGTHGRIAPIFRRFGTNPTKNVPSKP